MGARFMEFENGSIQLFTAAASKGRTELAIYDSSKHNYDVPRKPPLNLTIS